MTYLELSEAKGVVLRLFGLSSIIRWMIIGNFAAGGLIIGGSLGFAIGRIKESGMFPGSSATSGLTIGCIIGALIGVFIGTIISKFATLLFDWMAWVLKFYIAPYDDSQPSNQVPEQAKWKSL